MRSLCRRPAGAVPLVGPRISGPEDVRSALRLSMGLDTGEVVAVLLCDVDQNLMVVLPCEGATATDAARVVDAVVRAAAGTDVKALVVVVLRPAGSIDLTPDETSVLAGLRTRCRRAGLRLLDVVVMSGERWRSVADVAYATGEGDYGHQ
jgi:DNA repair protein RadC